MIVLKFRECEAHFLSDSFATLLFPIMLNTVRLGL